MKRLALLVACASVLSACAMFKTPMAPQTVPVVQAAPAQPIERIAFRPGISSVTVEKIGKQHGCVSNEGAGLVTEPGPVEVYRVVCGSGRVFMARCELRQCKAM